MSLAHTAWKIDTAFSLDVVAGILAISVLASIIHRKFGTRNLARV